MTETEYARKLDEIDRLLNDPNVPIEPSRIWSLLAEISPEASIADDISPDIFHLAAWTNPDLWRKVPSASLEFINREPPFSQYESIHDRRRPHKAGRGIDSDPGQPGPAEIPRRMDNYHIASTGSGFQVVENLPDGRCSTVSGFPTESDARTWLDGFLVLVGLVDCMAGEPNRRGGSIQNAG